VKISATDSIHGARGLSRIVKQRLGDTQTGRYREDEIWTWIEKRKIKIQRPELVQHYVSRGAHFGRMSGYISHLSHIILYSKPDEYYLTLYLL
jgi:hypothetical protein